MTNTNNDFVTLGADVGGKDAFDATNQHVLVLRNLLRQECLAVPREGINEIALVLRIDGSVQAWGESGVGKVSFQKKRAFVTADIFVSIDVWSTGDASNIRRFLVEQVLCAIQLIVDELDRKGIALDGKVFQYALEKVRQLYLE